MQVTCPNCSARYAVDPLAIGPMGRTVQCARCNERWFETVKVQPSPPPPPPPIEPPPEDPPAAGRASVTARLLPWLPFRIKTRKPAPEKTEPQSRPRVEPRAEPEPPVAVPAAANDEGKSSAARTSSSFDSAATGPVPDFIIRPGTRGAGLPALIEPKTNRRMGYVLFGAIALLLLMAAGMIVFHTSIANLLPPEWRQILHFDTSALALNVSPPAT